MRGQIAILRAQLDTLFAGRSWKIRSAYLNVMKILSPHDMFWWWERMTARSNHYRVRPCVSTATTEVYSQAVHL